MIEWQKIIEVGGALLSTTAGLLILEKIIAAWSKRTDDKRLEIESQLEREHEERQTYLSQMREDYQSLRRDLKEIESKLHTCEDERLKDRAELYRLREQLQLLQFRLAENEKEP